MHTDGVHVRDMGQAIVLKPQQDTMYSAQRQTLVSLSFIHSAHTYWIPAAWECNGEQNKPASRHHQGSMTGIEQGATVMKLRGITWFKGEVDYNIRMSNRLGRQGGQEDNPSEGINKNIRNAAKAPKGRGYTAC